MVPLEKNIKNIPIAITKKLGMLRRLNRKENGSFDAIKINVLISIITGKSIRLFIKEKENINIISPINFALGSHLCIVVSKPANLPVYMFINTPPTFQALLF
jgi:hypothetical protein